MSLKSKATENRFRCVAPAGDWCGEAPVWSTECNALYWADINRCLIHRLSLPDESVRTWFFDEPVTALALTASRSLLVALASRVVLWNPEDHSIREIGFRLEGWPKLRFNDGRVDARGSLWIGTMWNNILPDGTDGEVGGKDGMLYRVDPGGEVSVWARQIGIANTVTWSPDGLKFYFADTLANAVNVYGFDPTDGSIANMRPFLVDFPRGVPDGSVVDSEGYLWNCRVEGGCIVRVAPDGSIAGVIEFPNARPTSCTFGGENLQTLFVTSSALGTTGNRFAGGLFAMDTGIRGVAENRFAVPNAQIGEPS